jgi:hypothetical protein
MSSNVWIPIALAAAIAGGTGYQLGRRRPSPPSSGTPAAATSGLGTLPTPSRPIPARTNNPSAATATGSIEVRLRAVLREHPSRRWIRLSDIARSVKPAEAMEAIAAGNAILPAGMRENFRFQVLEHWAEVDPMAVLEYAQSLRDRNERTQALRPAVIEWARRDAAGALEWVQKLPAGSERRELLVAAIHGLGKWIRPQPWPASTPCLQTSASKPVASSSPQLRRWTPSVPRKWR